MRAPRLGCERKFMRALREVVCVSRSKTRRAVGYG
jgi:hypothetical protein